MSAHTHNPSRRRLVAGVAWSAPAAIAVSAAPAFAASPFDCPSNTHVARLPGQGGTSTSDGRTTTWRVPDGVTRVCFEVTGAGGGGNSGEARGGSGARLTGDFRVTPGEALTLTVGAGGARTPGVRGFVGGGGYGKGGDSRFPSTPAVSYLNSCGSGGGGSAILRGSDPLVVAGGGGGGAGAVRQNTSGHGWNVVAVTGGHAGLPGADMSMRHLLVNSSRVWANGAGGAADGTGGAAGGAGGVDLGSAHTRRDREIRAGVAGASGFGAAGADGVITANTYGSNSNQNTTIVSAGGGGGYGGGGSGAATSVYVTGRYDGSNYYAAGSVAGGGGGGGSFLASEVNNTEVGLANNGAASAGTRIPGSIIIYY